ncbi:MAG: tRNA (cytidine(56)-2'-O)-methyltransferase [Candidatus ainarchaeum sp.]|nr:tRNA (cytidine(56)-2'-O)-methyltransferase [Candidatus ainarchaeum sp.]
MQIEVLRLGHRLPRDERISTHVALVARAFGASAITYSGQHDSGLELSVKRICESWGGEFTISYDKSALAVMKQRKRDGFTIVHLTMYGLALPDVLPDIMPQDKLLVVVGSEQVPREIYELADFNVSVTGQPHSEVAALAITLDRLMQGKEFGLDLKGKLSIIPSAKGKNVRER